MTEDEFWKSFNLVEPYYPKKKVSKWKRTRLPPISNRKIQTSLRLIAIIRYFVGGCPLDIMSSHGIIYNDVYIIVWGMVDAINLCPKLAIKFPTCYKKQKEIACYFK